jgi:hypothetical protein
VFDVDPIVLAPASQISFSTGGVLREAYKQIGDKYDIFIGMLSTKFGSRTPRAGSGTEEEFNRGYGRFIKNPNELRIVFYFKDPELRAS